MQEVFGVSGRSFARTGRACARLMAPPRAWGRWRAVWWGLAGGLVVGQWVSLVWGLELTFPRHTMDFAQHYYLGAWRNLGGAFTDPAWPLRWVAAWPKGLGAMMPYLPYQPLLLPWMQGLARLPYAWALLVWWAGALGLWWWAARGVARVGGWAVGCVRLGLFLAPPLAYTLYLGNVDAYLAALTVLATVGLSHAHPVLSGYVWGWVIAFKPFLVFGAWPAWRRRPRAFGVGGLLGAGSALGVAWAAVGREGLAFLVRHLPAYQQALQQHLAFFNGSLLGWWTACLAVARRAEWPSTPDEGLARGLALVTGVVLLGFTLRARPRGLDEPLGLWLETGLGLSLALLLAPIAWPQYRVYALAPALILTGWLAGRSSRLAHAWYGFLPFYLVGFLWPLEGWLPALYLGSVHAGLWGFFWAALRFGAARARDETRGLGVRHPGRGPKG